jgi:hypothetical protein
VKQNEDNVEGILIISTYSCIVKKGQHIFINANSCLKTLIAVIICCMPGLKVCAQFATKTDFVFTFKDSCINFSVTENDSLSPTAKYTANKKSGPSHGVVNLDSSKPFNAAYCPNAGFTGVDTFKYELCDTATAICKEAFVCIKIEAISNANVAWAGDINHDGQVSALDYLFLANAIKNRGNRMPGKSTGWKSSYAVDWNEYLWGVDLKYADGDGNGLIDTNDLKAINNNLLKTRTNYTLPFSTYGYEKNKTVSVFAKMSKKNFVMGDTLAVEVFFGDSLGLAIADRDITGAAFRLTLNADIATNLKNAKAWFVTNDNWITKSAPQKIEVVARHADKFAFDVALSKLYHTNFDRNQAANCNNLKMQLTTRDKLDNTQYADVYSTISGGKAPYAYFWSNGSTTPNVSGINNVFPSNHNLMVIDANGCKANSEVTLLDRSNGGRGSLGTLKVIIEDDIMQIKNNSNKNLEFILEQVYLIDDQQPEFVTVDVHHDKLKSFVNTIYTDKNVTNYQIRRVSDREIEILFEEEVSVKDVTVFDILGQRVGIPVIIDNHRVSLFANEATNQQLFVQIKTNSGFQHIKLNF